MTGRAAPASRPAVAGNDVYAFVFFAAVALAAALFAGAGFAAGFRFGVAAALAGAFFATAFFATAFFTGAFAAASSLEPFHFKRAFLASATTLAMSSSVYTPLTPEMAASFMPCLMPSL